MNVLIVDDDLIEIRVIESIIDRERLEVEEIFTASRVSAARELLESRRVDVVICDIEMPRENGLELLEWMKERHHPASAIILTSHADFGYASRAIKAGTENYLLKPVEDQELNDALADVVRKRKEKKKQQMAEKNWDYHLRDVREEYFREAACGILAGSKEEMRKTAGLRGIELPENARYTPVLFCAKKWEGTFAGYSQHMQHFIMKNIAGEILDNHGIRGVCCGINERGILVVTEEALKREELQQVSREFLDVFYQLYRCELCAYPGEETGIEWLAEAVRILSARERNNIIRRREVIFSDSETAAEDIGAFDYEAFGRAMSQEGAEGALRLIREALSERIRRQALDGERLIKFQKNILQESNVLLKAAGLKANLVFEEESYRKLEAESCLSVENFEEWAEYLMRKMDGLFGMMKSSSSVVERAEDYIKGHLDTIESCQDVAHAVYLDADYLSRLFRKKKGISLQKYLNQARIDQVKHLLTFTDLSVSEIAIQTGYKNFSHFSTAFKREEHMTPVEYRKNYARIRE